MELSCGVGTPEATGTIKPTAPPSPPNTVPQTTLSTEPSISAAPSRSGATSTSHSNAGAIAGGIVGGLAVIAIFAICTHPQHFNTAFAIALMEYKSNPIVRLGALRMLGCGNTLRVLCMGRLMSKIKLESFELERRNISVVEY